MAEHRRRGNNNALDWWKDDEDKPLNHILLIARGNIRKNKTTKDPLNIFVRLRIMKLLTFEKYGQGETRTTNILGKHLGNLSKPIL